MTSLDEFADFEAEKAELKASLYRTQQQLRRARGKVDDLVEATLNAATDAVRGHGKIGATPAPAKDRRAKARPEVALWVTSDWQGSKVTPTYNSDVMRRRVLQFAEKCVRLTEIQRADHPVRDCTIAFGGDMVEGLFNFPTQPFEIDATLFEQWVNVSALIVDVVKVALANYEHVTIVPEWGNHGRIGSKRDCVPRSDNVDRMCYEFAKRMLEAEKRLTWQDCPEDVQRLEIGAYRALVIHGDEVGRNGFASSGTLVGHVNKWQAGGYKVDGEAWSFRDVYSHHYHTHAEFPLPNGEGSVFQTGSTESDNRYAAVHLASQALPSQRLHFIDPDKGRVTAQYRVLLD
jgi:hypothetical protein